MPSKDVSLKFIFLTHKNMAAKIYSIIPKLPSKDLNATRTFYEENLGFQKVGGDYPDYLMMRRDLIEIHFFLHVELNELENYGMCYVRVEDIEGLYEEMKRKEANFPKLWKLERKPWNQNEFSLIDKDHNLITFGEGL
jgi:hypothetical protein